MTTLTTAETVAGSRSSKGGYGSFDAVRSEWTKLRSVRSTSFSLLATAALTIAIGVLATATEANRWAQAPVPDRLTFDPTSLSLTGLLFAQLAVGVLGILVMSAEYSTGTIRATLSAIPRRPMVLAAKGVVFGAVSVIVGEVLSFAAFFIGQAILSGTTPTAALGDPGVLRAVVGGGLYLAVLGMLALGLATIIRHTAGAISALVGVLFILPLISQALPSSIRHNVAKYLPAMIGSRMTTVHQAFNGTPSFSPWVGFAIMCGYAAASLAVGGWLLVRRDA